MELTLSRIHSSEESADSSDDGGGENTGEIVLRGHAISNPLVVLSGTYCTYPTKNQVNIFEREKDYVKVCVRIVCK